MYFNLKETITNEDLTKIFTPVNAEVLKELLEESNYNKEKTKFLVDGFTEGFDLGYRGKEDVQITSPNLKFTVGSRQILWDKVMKEVEAKRYAGPFEKIPFENYIQSPIGLVPKDKNKTRLIFHLSFPRNTGKSVNENTPANLCKVKYKDFDFAVKLCLKKGSKKLFGGKSDMTSAFRHCPIKPKHWRYLVMKAKNPQDNKWYYFVDKCLPFGASISCAIFQAFSDAISHIVKHKTGEDNVNYLDDYLFIAVLEQMCNWQLETFLEVCEAINFPVSMEKTQWATTSLVFLGLLLDLVNGKIGIPLEKIAKGIRLIENLLQKTNKKRNPKGNTGSLRFLEFSGKSSGARKGLYKKDVRPRKKPKEKTSPFQHYQRITSRFGNVVNLFELKRYIQP